jgi:hypothetical protein
LVERETARSDDLAKVSFFAAPGSCPAQRIG